jgi:hypothetical protein
VGKFFKDKEVFSIKEFFLSGVGCLRVGGGGGIKKFSAVKISVQGLGACGSGRAMFSGQNFLRLSILLFIEYITFRGGQKGSNTERTIRSTDVADAGRGRVVGNYFSFV